MALEKKYQTEHKAFLRDVRPLYQRIADSLKSRDTSFTLFISAAVSIHVLGFLTVWLDVYLIVFSLYFWWLTSREKKLAFKMPFGAKFKDPNNNGPGSNNKPEGIMYLGNDEKTKEEIWFTSKDVRTHVLYLGTTGSGKTVGLEGMCTNAMSWGSGFVYIDGKADTDVWSDLSSLIRRFGRDDDLLVLNYMTGNSDAKAPSNSMNPFASGSSSYLTNMLTSLMPDAEGDNAMWKERAISLIGAVMPALTWKRDNQDLPLNVSSLRQYLTLQAIVRLSKEDAIPEQLKQGVMGYLDTLPGFNKEAWDDNGKEKKGGPGSPAIDQGTAHQQHGYLSMQFTRSLQSLGDDYGYIFDAEYADIIMQDVVLNRRILVVLIPALEKSADEVANLGKIIAATLKGMMGSSLGSSIEGEASKVIENKPTHSATPFVCVFDEVGYYAASGMAVMAAQARSLGFSLVFAGQDLPAMEKRVKEEARSIAANCNIKIFGKLEDPTQTKEFFEKTVGSALVVETSGFQTEGNTFSKSYFDGKQAGMQSRSRASYDGLRSFKEGQAVITFGDELVDAKMFYANPNKAKAMRVTRFMPLPPSNEGFINNATSIAKLRDRMIKKGWTAAKADVHPENSKVFTALKQQLDKHPDYMGNIDHSISAVVHAHGLENDLDKAPAASAPPAKETASKAGKPEPKPVRQPVEIKSQSKQDKQPQTTKVETPTASQTTQTSNDPETSEAMNMLRKAARATRQKLRGQKEGV